MKIWVLSIWHRHGTNVTPCASREIAESVLDAYIKQWWAREVGDEPIPEDREKMRVRYFEKAEDEGADIEEKDLATEKVDA